MHEVEGAGLHSVSNDGVDMKRLKGLMDRYWEEKESKEGVSDVPTLSQLKRFDTSDSTKVNHMSQEKDQGVLTRKSRIPTNPYSNVRYHMEVQEFGQKLSEKKLKKLNSETQKKIIIADTKTVKR